jgi:predicted PurR-regulated permease PerM
MDDIYLRKVIITVILSILAVLSFLVLKPILLAIIVGIILTVIFAPLYNWTFKILKSKNFSAALVCIFLILLIIMPFWFLTPIFVKQSFEVYLVSQQMDFVTPLKAIFPDFFASEEFSAEIGSIIHSFVTSATNSLVNSLSQLIINFPTLFLQLLVVFFTFFFVLKDKEEIVSYTKSLLPFSGDVKERLFKSSKEITISVTYGQILIGMIQGLIVSIGFFIFGINNAMLLTLLAILAGMFPVIGTTIVWLPVVIYLFIAGNTIPAIGITFFGVISNLIDNILRPIFVSRLARMHPLLILIGMIGGLFFFGILGFILGPLILAYSLIMLEVYRGRQISGIFIRK